MAEKWDLTVDVEVNGSVVTVCCTSTQLTKGASDWTRTFSSVDLDLGELSDEIKEALAIEGESQS